MHHSGALRRENARLCRRTMPSSPAKAGDPVFQRRLKINREAAACWIVRSSRTMTAPCGAAQRCRMGKAHRAVLSNKRCRVGKAQRAHRLVQGRKVGTAQARLCPPYETENGLCEKYSLLDCFVALLLATTRRTTRLNLPCAGALATDALFWQCGAPFAGLGSGPAALPSRCLSGFVEGHPSG
jgi:hypothetical protein